MKRSYSGAESGKGAVYGWEGNKNVGSGRMEILEASAPSKIMIKLDFFKPFEGHNTAEFTMLPQGDAHQPRLGDARPLVLHLEGDAGVHESRPHDRQGFRGRPRQSEEAHREIGRQKPQHQGASDAINPYLFFDGNCEAAFKFYEKVLGGKIEMLMRNEDAPAGHAGAAGAQEEDHARQDVDRRRRS